mgnify:FL=1
MATVLLQHTHCRVCAAPLEPSLSLGDLFLSDFPQVATDRAHPAVPLELVRCTGGTCGLVQLAHSTPPAWLYGETYWYYSGVNDTMRAELLDVVRGAAARTTLPKHAIVVDIGANDGTLLQQYTAVVGDDHFLLKVAYEPARSHYAALRPHVHVLYPEYFTVDDPWPLPTKARIITAIAMFYDLEDPHAFVASLTKALHPDGVVVIQQAYLFSMLATTDISNIGHEHLEYYHLAPLEKLLAAHGLEVVDVELRAINGGSFRVCVQFTGRGVVSPRVAERRAEEARLLAIQPLLWQTFIQRAEAIRTQLLALLHAYRDHGTPVDLYAASTKANTLIQWCGVDHRLIRQAWERTPQKVGRYVGVSGIPIVSEAEGRQDPPAALLVGAWQFRDNFLSREAEYLAAGGRIIFPLPYVEVVEQQTVKDLKQIGGSR